MYCCRRDGKWHYVRSPTTEIAKLLFAPYMSFVDDFNADNEPYLQRYPAMRRLDAYARFTAVALRFRQAARSGAEVSRRNEAVPGWTLSPSADKIEVGQLNLYTSCVHSDSALTVIQQRVVVPHSLTDVNMAVLAPDMPPTVMACHLSAWLNAVVLEAGTFVDQGTADKGLHQSLQHVSSFSTHCRGEHGPGSAERTVKGQGA